MQALLPQAFILYKPQLLKLLFLLLQKKKKKKQI